jgi:hypothetical protein
MGPAQRRAYLQQQSENLRYQQHRNALAAKLHRRRTIQRLHAKGIYLSRLRHWQLE